jgi:hypothetical protein
MMRHSAANGRSGGRGNSDSRNSPPGRRLNTLGGQTDGYPRMTMRRNTDAEQEQNWFERSSMQLPEAKYEEFEIDDASSEESVSEIEIPSGGFRPATAGDVLCGGKRQISGHLHFLAGGRSGHGKISTR